MILNDFKRGSNKISKIVTGNLGCLVGRKESSSEDHSFIPNS